MHDCRMLALIGADKQNNSLYVTSFIVFAYWASARIDRRGCRASAPSCGEKTKREREKKEPEIRRGRSRKFVRSSASGDKRENIHAPKNIYLKHIIHIIFWTWNWVLAFVRFGACLPSSVRIAETKGKKTAGGEWERKRNSNTSSIGSPNLNVCADLHHTNIDVNLCICSSAQQQRCQTGRKKNSK